MPDINLDYLDPNTTYIDKFGRPTRQFILFWMRCVDAIKSTFAGLAAAESDITDLQNDSTNLKAVPYVTIGNVAATSAERSLVPTPGELVGTDGGANSTYALGLADTAVTAGTYGDASNIPQITVDAKGRLTNAVNVPVQIAVWAPLTSGAEPIELVSDGQGQCIMVAI